MIEELGDGLYKLTTDDGEGTFLTELEISEIVRWKEQKEKEGTYLIKRYNTPSREVKRVFEQHYNRSTTKKFIFKKIAPSLGITWKAVEKSYYKKEKE